MNKRRQLVCAMASAGAAAALSYTAFVGAKRTAAPDHVIRRTARALGAEVTLVAMHRSSERAERAIAAAFAEIEQVESLMSLYRPESELNRLNRDGVVENPHPHLLAVLERARTLSERTDGAFDVTVQPLWNLYAGAHREGHLPNGEAVAQTRATVNYRSLEISPRRVRIKEKMAVTLNGIAQGFAADRALAALRAWGIENALVNTGELGSLSDGGKVWTAGIQDPRRSDALLSAVALDGRCMATSGDYATSFSRDHAYNHIFDPATGRSPQTFSSVTVLARTGIDADGLSTAVFVLGLAKGLRLIAAWPGADALVVSKDGSVLSTSGFPRGLAHA